MADHDQLPELYTQREVDKTRRRQRWLGRFEGGAAVAAVGVILSLLGSWVPTALVLVVVGYVVYRLLAKPKDETEA